jgi:hypothetical protein
MTILTVILGILFALVAVGAFALIALFIICDMEADKDKERHENKTHHRKPRQSKQKSSR